MSTTNEPSRPRREQPSTYFVQDRSNQDELSRLAAQARILTSGMGGVLPEQEDPTIFQRVLDVGCGTGDWLIETAKTYPTTSLLIGIDISGKMIEYARAQAAAEQVSDRVEFHTMDALRVLEFPDKYFDLVNMRLATGYLRTWDWPRLLQEFQRVTRSGGVIRLTECDTASPSNSAAQERLSQVMVQTLYRAGHLFNEKSDSVMHELAPLLTRYGLRNVQSRFYTLAEYPRGSAEWENGTENLRLLFKTLVPFFRKWGQLPDDYDATYQQMLSDIQQPDYSSSWTVLIAWGTVR